MIKAEIKGIKYILYTENESRNDNKEDYESSDKYNSIFLRCSIPYPLDNLEKHESVSNKVWDDYNEARMRWLANELQDKNAKIERIETPDDCSWRYRIDENGCMQLI